MTPSKAPQLIVRGCPVHLLASRGGTLRSTSSRCCSGPVPAGPRDRGRAGNCRMVRRCLRQHQPEKFTERKRIRRTPRNRALGVQAFEIADQQQPEVASGRQARSANLLGIELLAESFDVSVEVMLVENLIQPRVERMRGRPRQILGRHPHRGLLRVPPSFAHRHRRQCSTQDRSGRSSFNHSV